MRIPAAYAECVRRGRREDRVCLPPSQRDPVDFDQAVAHLQAAVGGAAGRDLRHEVLRIQDQAQGALASGDGYAELLLAAGGALTDWQVWTESTTQFSSSSESAPTFWRPKSTFVRPVIRTTLSPSLLMSSSSVVPCL